MVPENPTALSPDQLVQLSVAAAGDMDDPNTYSARLVETMAVLTELALPDLAAQIIEAGKETSKAGSPFNYFVRGIIRETEYNEKSSRGFVWVEPARVGDRERARPGEEEEIRRQRAREGEDYQVTWRFASDGKTPLELFKTERVFYAQGRAVFSRAKQLIGHRATLVKHVYSGKDGNNHRDVVAIIDRGKVRGDKQRPAPAPAPVEDPGPAPAPKQDAPAPQPAPDPAPAPTDAPPAEPTQNSAPAPSAADVPLVSGQDPRDPAFVPMTPSDVSQAYTALGYTQKWVHEQVYAARNRDVDPKNYASTDPAVIAALWSDIIIPDWKSRNPEEAERFGHTIGGGVDDALLAALQ